MPNANIQSTEQLQDQIYALQQLVLAQGVALSIANPEASKAAFVIAGGQARALASQGRELAAMRLDRLVEEIQQCIN